MKQLVLVTYRDRLTHLNVFRLYMQKYFPHLTIAVIQQNDDCVWNKGLLFNVGYHLLSKDYDYIILHDVDFIPATNVDYSPTALPTLLSTECSQFNYGYYFDAFFGGVVGMSKYHYELINGFSNQFRGYGGEDDLLYQSFIQKGIMPVKRLGNRFENFQHPKPDVRPGSQYYNTADYQNNLMLAISPRDFTDGLSNCMDYIREQPQVIYDNNNNYIHIRVNTCQQ